MKIRIFCFDKSDTAQADYLFYLYFSLCNWENGKMETLGQFVSRCEKLEDLSCDFQYYKLYLLTNKFILI